jgi:hypothetical protein
VVIISGMGEQSLNIEAFLSNHAPQLISKGRDFMLLF